MLLIQQLQFLKLNSQVTYATSSCSSRGFFLLGSGSSHSISTDAVSPISYFASGFALGFLQQHVQHAAMIRIPNNTTDIPNAARAATGSLWNHAQNLRLQCLNP